MSREVFSHGYNSRVFRVTPEQSAQFNSADLVREVERKALMRNPNHFLELYYGYKITNLLFPDNFITVVGAQRGEPSIDRPLFDNEPQGPNLFPHRLFSREAAVPPDHAQYTAEMGEYDPGIKECVCRCSTCREHDAFHRENNLEKQAREFVLKTKGMGISFPSTDPSDYCLSDNGILFFEIDGFKADQVQVYLEGLGDLSQSQQQALSLVKRYQIICSKPPTTKRTVGEYIL